MQEELFKRSAVAAAVGSIVLVLSAGAAFGAGFALQENSGSAVGNAFAGGAAAAEDASTVWSNPAGMSRLASPQVAAAVHFDYPLVQVQGRRLGTRRLPAARRHRRRCGQPQHHSEPLRRPMPINRAVERRPRHQRAVRARHRIRRQLARPLPGRQVGNQDDQRQPRGVVAGDQHVRRGRRRQLAARRRRVDAEGQLQRQRSFRQPDRRRRRTDSAGAAADDPRGHAPGLESKAKVEGDDSAWGWNIGFLWDATPQTRIGAQYRS